MIEYRLAQDRFRTLAESRATFHSFSFGTHYDATNVGFGSLVAHNDERLPPGTGYADHPHADLEIVTWVLTGSLRHTSTVGSGVIGPGQVQRLSAGSGVVHSEVADSDEETRFLQAWVRPDEDGLAPGYLATEVPRTEGWIHVADGDGHGVVPLGSTGTSLHAVDLGTGQRVDLPNAPRLHVFVARGQVMLGERLLEAGDAARLVDEGGRAVKAEADSHLVVWAFKNPPSPGR
ncbi:MAG: Pirin domain protein [Marmoricola sp.]|nr:Pirin domain protein [Marmoricola sp.]